MTQDKSLRDHLLYLLRGGGAHLKFEDLVADFPLELVNRKMAGVPYTPWQVLEHLRIAQWDILEFSRDARHQSPEFPQGYWPPAEAVADAAQWNESIRAFQADLKQLEELVADPAIDLFAAIPHGDGQTILREALLVADHNAYHLGALAIMKRSLNSEPE